jgi:hypothetical protein
MDSYIPITHQLMQQRVISMRVPVKKVAGALFFWDFLHSSLTP